MNDAEGTIEEQEIFGAWLRDRWREKGGSSVLLRSDLDSCHLADDTFVLRPDDLVERYITTGSFVGVVSQDKMQEVVLPLKLRRIRDHAAVFSYGLPVFILYFGLPLVSSVVKRVVQAVF